MRLTDVGIATCKKGWVFSENKSSNGCILLKNATLHISWFSFSDIKASKGIVPPPSLTSSKPCTSATGTVRSWASSPCSLKPGSPHLLRNLNPSLLLLPRRKRLGQHWRASHNKRGNSWTSGMVVEWNCNLFWFYFIFFIKAGLRCFSNFASLLGVLDSRRATGWR